jgi:hypothetical protein
MSKLRSDSAWAALSPEQRETLEGWLFEENLGYKEALERAQKEFGITASLRSLSEYYQRAARERTQEELLTVKATAEEIDKAEVNLEDLGATAMTLVAKRMIQLAVESPGKVKEMVSLGRILVANEAQDIKRRWLEMEEDRVDAEIQKQFERAKKAAEWDEEIKRILAPRSASKKPEAGEVKGAGK